MADDPAAKGLAALAVTAPHVMGAEPLFTGDTRTYSRVGLFSEIVNALGNSRE